MVEVCVTCLWMVDGILCYKIPLRMVQKQNLFLLRGFHTIPLNVNIRMHLIYGYFPPVLPLRSYRGIQLESQ